MKKILAFLLVSTLLVNCDIRNTKDEKKSETEADTRAHDHSGPPIKDSTTVAMIDSVYNFGKITDGEKVEFSFRFRNTGSNPLIITGATASCGCTVPETPEEPIAPGQIGHIKAVFNSKGRVGAVDKAITVGSNATPGFPNLKIIGEVTAKN